MQVGTGDGYSGTATLPVRVDYDTLFLRATPLIDVRAPVEFARGSFPTAVSLPLMNDDERHRVGVRYKQAGQEAAIELGARLLTPALREQRTEAWKRFLHAHPDAALYCFRGGLRSRIVQRWLAEAGIACPRIHGGYKALRAFLIGKLAELSGMLPFVLIAGRTGSGKTILLRQLDRAIDLEAQARHRGSSFGRLPGAQPTNIDFENAVTIELLRLAAQSASCVYLEDEARMIGRVCLPEPLRAAMERSAAIVLEASMSQRINNARQDYVGDLLDCYRRTFGERVGFQAYAEHHRDSLGRIRKRLGGKAFATAVKLLEAALDRHREHNDPSGYDAFIGFILERYYDPMYDYQLARKHRRVVFSGNAAEVLQWINRQC